MERLRHVWPLLLFVLASCASAAKVCPEPQLFVNGECVELCADIDCDDSNECTSEECVVNEQELMTSCIRTDVPDGRDCDTADASPGVCMTGQCTGVCDPPDCDDANDCTVDGTCNTATGRCEGSQDAPEGTACDGTGVCDGAGNCLECSQPVDCPEATEDCKAKSCEANICGSNNSATDGTPCDGGAGVCQEGTCRPSNMCLDAGTRCDDDKECTDNLCDPDTGDCSNPPVANGTTLCAGGNGECVDGQCDLCVRISCAEPHPCVKDGTCDPATGICQPGDDEPADALCDIDGGQFCDGQGNCVACTSATHCNDGEQCTVDSCNASGVCVNEPKTDGTDCDSGEPAGACLGAMCVPIAPDDDVDPVDPIEIDFAQTEVATRTNRVSYPFGDPAVGDAQDTVSYRIQATGSGGFFGRLTIVVECDPDPGDNVEVFAFGETTKCNAPFALNRIVTNDSGNTGSVQIEAVAGEGTYVVWTLKMATCPNNNFPCIGGI